MSDINDNVWGIRRVYRLTRESLLNKKSLLLMFDVRIWYIVYCRNLGIKWNDCARLSPLFIAKIIPVYTIRVRSGLRAPFPLPRHHPLWHWQLPNTLMRSLFKTCPVVTQYAVTAVLLQCSKHNNDEQNYLKYQNRIFHVHIIFMNIMTYESRIRPKIITLCAITF